MTYNPYIHGTSSQTLAMMQGTDFQLMPILAMLETFKVAPMVGELTQGGFDIIGDGSNHETITGAPAFGQMTHHRYDLDIVSKNYTAYPDNVSLEACKKSFKYFLNHSHKSAFTHLNLLMIYMVRLRQLGANLSDVASLEDINTLKTRLHATVQFYYFMLCIQKYIFIDSAAIELFKKENNLDGYYELGDFIEHFFSFENFMEKIGKNQFNIEEIYNDPSQENINKLLEFVKIPKDTQETVKKYPDGEVNFIAGRDYNFFTSEQPHSENNASEKIGGYLFTNNSSYSFAHYLENYYQAWTRAQVQVSGEHDYSYPDFAGFHTKVLPYVEALKDRIQLCNTLIDADDNEFVIQDKNDELITSPFPVVFVTEANTLEELCNEFRSRKPLKLGQEITLVATDSKHNQARLRDYLQKNNIGPVEVLLFDDLYTLRSHKDANYFDALLNDDITKAFELAKKQNCVAQFSEFYRALSELNAKRFQFKSTNPEMFDRLNDMFTELQQTVLTPDKGAIDFTGMQDVLKRNMDDNHSLYATHRGVLGVIDTLLTILASLIIFYPITYLVQKNNHSTYTFFATDTEKKINDAIDVVDDVLRQGVAMQGV